MKDRVIIHPKKINYPLHCVGCGSKRTEPIDFFFSGAQSLVDCRCEECGTEFYDLLPTAHGLHFAVSFSKNGKFMRFTEQARLWLAEPLIDAVLRQKSAKCPIRNELFFETKNAVLLNCLDACYGHVFLKLLNAQFHLENREDLIVLIPASFRWLVPDGVAEVWSVEAPLSAFRKKIEGLNEFIKVQSQRFERLSLSPAYIHPDSTRIRFELFLKERKFDLKEFAQKQPTICFVIREDRLWLGGILWSFFYRAAKKIGLHVLLPIFLKRQRNLFRRTASRIRRGVADCRFIVTGVGRRINYSMFADDVRSGSPTELTERSWCTLYAQAHVVIGVHGSGMLIPTALSAGFLEILPRYKIDHLTEDVVLNYKNRYSHFLGRYIDEFTKPGLIARHVISMVKNFDFFRQTTELSVPESYYSEPLSHA